jgi:hypothetical protein
LQENGPKRRHFLQIPHPEIEQSLSEISRFGILHGRLMLIPHGKLAGENEWMTGVRNRRLAAGDIRRARDTAYVFLL